MLSAAADAFFSVWLGQPKIIYEEIIMTLVQKPAPEFDAQGVIDGDFKQLKLSDYKGKWLVLFFYPLDFTFVCPTEITAFF